MDIEQLLKTQGLKVTPQRKAILSVMEDSRAFLSAQDLFVRVKELHPSTNFSTIYRNLEVLLGKKILCCVTPDEAGTMYRLRKDENHHHHALCRSCGASIPMDCPMEEVYEKLRDHGFTPEGHTFEVYGYCKDCGERE